MSDPRQRQVVKVGSEPLAAIVLGGRAGAKQAFRWGAMLVWFMRIVAVLWIFHSLLNWCEILGIAAPNGADLASLGNRGLAATIFFAAVDPIAALGLWFATPWGGVTWLFAVIAQIFVVFLLPSISENGPLLMATNAALVLCYFILTFAASREGEGD